MNDAEELAYRYRIRQLEEECGRLIKENRKFHNQFLELRK